MTESKAAYMAEYRKRKASGKFKDRRRKNFPDRYCLWCNKNIGKDFRESKRRKYCDTNCQQNYMRKKAVLAGNAGETALKRYLLDTNGHQCSNCKRKTWLGNPITLELDHKNGNGYDNRLVNVRLLCPNCHSVTPNYRSKNPIGRGKREKPKREYYIK